MYSKEVSEILSYIIENIEESNINKIIISSENDKYNMNLITEDDRSIIKKVDKPMDYDINGVYTLNIHENLVNCEFK